MKKVYILLLIFISTLNLVACGSTDTYTTDSSSSNPNITQGISTIQDTKVKTDNDKIGRILQINTGLKMYYDDEGNYPIVDKLTPATLENLPGMEHYLSEMLEGAYYMPLKNNGTENTSFILAAELDGDNRINCKIAASDMDDLQRIIEENDNEVLNIIKAMDKSGVQEGPCFYVLVNG